MLVHAINGIIDERHTQEATAARLNISQPKVRRYGTISLMDSRWPTDDLSHRTRSRCRDHHSPQAALTHYRSNQRGGGVNAARSQSKVALHFFGSMRDALDARVVPLTSGLGPGEQEGFSSWS